MMEPDDNVYRGEEDDRNNIDELLFGSAPRWTAAAASSPFFLPSRLLSHCRRPVDDLEFFPSEEYSNSNSNRRKNEKALKPPSVLAGVRSCLPVFLRHEKRFSRITNCVVKVFFSHQIYRPWIVLYVPYAEYVPGKLPAVKIRLTNGFSNTTCLIFHSGFMILTGARTFYTAYRDAMLYCRLFQDIPQPALVHAAGSGRPPPGPATVAMLASEEVGTHANDPAVRMTARPLGPRLQICSATIVNTVSTGVLCAHSLALDKIKRSYPESTSYDPHAFAGLYFTVRSEDCPELEDLLPPPGGEIMFGDRFVGGDVTVRERKRVASVFDSGSCSIIGHSSREANFAIYRHLARLFHSFDDPMRPRSRDQIHAYRLHHFLNQRKHENPVGDHKGAKNHRRRAVSPMHDDDDDDDDLMHEEQECEQEDVSESHGNVRSVTMEADADSFSDDMDAMLIEDFLGLSGLQ